ncbi:hypothetical protein GCM10017556_26470 [Micromonospora sagamiensis]|uniref:Uncharacterized protein n=1 Tax=Micromonospora sagamiensis TaxID=47875 RepID=A0A562WP96_9ACTN|nr:hypothetical protein JD81_05604 [Micromonospora sagamiensis]BCL14908.1 hypothetical protein GCM10017556_26470 [Micromonospora sagamiensis]
MDGSGRRRSDDGRRVVGMLRRASLCVDGAGVVAVLMGRQDVATCAGVLSVVLRTVAEWREGAARR